MDALKKEGVKPVSARRIVDWHQRGLLPRPRRVHKGKGKGTEGRYPTGTLEQLRFLIRLKTEEHIRTVSVMRLRLWIEGYTIPIGQVREDILSLLPDPGAMKPELARDKAEKDMSQYRASKRRKKFALETDLLTLAYGGNYVTYHSDKEFEKVMDLQGASTDSINGVGPWLPTDVGEHMSEYAKNGLFDFHVMAYSVKRADDKGMLEARKVVCDLMSVHPIINDLQRLIGRKRLGLDAVSRITLAPFKNPALLLAFFIHSQEIGINYSLGALESLKQLSPMLHEFEKLRESNPTLAKTVAKELAKMVVVRQKG